MSLFSKKVFDRTSKKNEEDRDETPKESIPNTKQTLNIDSYISSGAESDVTLSMRYSYFVRF
jgi:hypothetical protein